jgi:D-alanine transaminase
MTPTPTELAYVDGRVLPASEAKVPLWDRGFLFAESAYEVCLGRGGRIFGFAEHQERLLRTIEGILLPGAAQAVAEVERASRALIAAFGSGTFMIYAQVTGGVAPRNHVLPVDPAPAVYATIRGFDLAAVDRDQARGLKVLTQPDLRWRRATYKTTQLLPNVMAKKAARAAGADEILFVGDDGVVLEGGSTNFFWVEGDEYLTTPLDRNLLPGVTRRTAIERTGVRVRETEADLARILRSAEAFVSGTTREATAVVEIDGRRIGDGRPGPRTRELARKLRALFDVECPPR